MAKGKDIVFGHRNIYLLLSILPRNRERVLPRCAINNQLYRFPTVLTPSPFVTQEWSTAIPSTWLKLWHCGTVAAVMRSLCNGFISSKPISAVLRVGRKAMGHMRVSCKIWPLKSSQPLPLFLLVFSHINHCSATITNQSFFVPKPLHFACGRQDASKTCTFSGARVPVRQA